MTAAAPDRSQILGQLGSEDRTIQRLACDEIARLLPEEPDLREALLDLLRNGSVLSRFASAFILFQHERPGMRLLPALLDALDLPDGDIRWQATHMLSTLGRLQGEVLPVVLHEAVEAKTPRRRRMALYALRELAPERPETAAVFSRALDDADADVRRAALTCFAKLGEPQREAVDRVVEIARGHEDPRMARIATIVLPDLVEHHPETRPQVNALLTELRDSQDASLARAANVAVQRLDGA